MASEIAAHFGGPSRRWAVGNGPALMGGRRAGSRPDEVDAFSHWSLLDLSGYFLPRYLPPQLATYRLQANPPTSSRK